MNAMLVLSGYLGAALTCGEATTMEPPARGDGWPVSVFLAPAGTPGAPTVDRRGGPATDAELPLVVVDRDNVQITRSCRVQIAPGTTIADGDGNGVIRVTADGVTVVFERGSVLRGATAASQNQPGGVWPDAYSGTGVRVEAKNVTLRGLHVEAYRVGVWAQNADGLTIEGSLFADLRRQRLKSTPAGEEGGDWLWPHENDDDQWPTRYGAAVYVKDSQNVTLRENVGRAGQNGLVLSRVKASRVYDNDFSFLSGWGLAMWRGTGAVISRNAFDFCVRGYSHGVYNRGQDSAGILFFEQCSGNTVAENSATHGGDGFFGFAGKDALGERTPDVDPAAFARLGCNNNLLIRNDFSYAPAHGIEMTFSFGNRFMDNRLVGNAITGIWGGYSQDTLIHGNTIADNGLRGRRRGEEGGGINIEHGARNVVQSNSFADNTVDVSLWSDDDASLLRLPWAKANHKGSVGNRVVFNRFAGAGPLVRLMKTTGTVVAGNTSEPRDAPPVTIDRDEASDVVTDAGTLQMPVDPGEVAIGRTRPVGRRATLQGRENIVMSEWGPWDHAATLIRVERDDGYARTYGLFGLPDGQMGVELDDANTKSGAVVLRPRAAAPGEADVPGRAVALEVASVRAGVHPYTVTLTLGDSTRELSGTLINTLWTVRAFAFKADPRKDLPAWRAEAAADGVPEGQTNTLRLALGYRGPSAMDLGEAIKAAKLPRENYGLVATTTLPLPPGTYRITTLSDDGVRVVVRQGGGLGVLEAGGDAEAARGAATTVIENWTHHAPATDRGTFTVAGDQPRPVVIDVEYFQLDGYAVLELSVERVSP